MIPRSVHDELLPPPSGESHGVMRLLSHPRQQAHSCDVPGVMPDDAQERLRKSLQSCLRQTLLRLVSALDVSEAGTSKLLSVPLGHLHNLVAASSVEGVAWAEQWRALARCVGARKVTQGRWHEPNSRVQVLSTVVYQPYERVLLRRAACSHPLSASWYFVHPPTGRTQVLTPSARSLSVQEVARTVVLLSRRKRD